MVLQPFLIFEKARGIFTFVVSNLFVAMASLSESAAHFGERMVSFGVPADLMEKLRVKQFVNFVQLAHCVSIRPGEDESKYLEFMEGVNGGAIEDVHKAALRRAYAEAKATVVFDMRQRFDPSEGTGSVRQVPRVELASRLDDAKKRLMQGLGCQWRLRTIARSSQCSCAGEGSEPVGLPCARQVPETRRRVVGP
eukprot:6485553-Amphidinium_carterae.2